MIAHTLPAGAFLASALLAGSGSGQQLGIAEELGRHVVFANPEILVLADFDADGLPEYLTSDHVQGVVCRNGSDGRQRWRTPWNSLIGVGICLTEDLDADGYPDCGIWSGSTIRLHSSRTGAWIRDHVLPPGQGVISAASTDDRNGDGLRDLVVLADDGALGTILRLVDPQTGTVLQEVGSASGAIPVGYSLAVLDDQDGDGVADLAIGDPRADWLSANQAGAVHVLSGANGSTITSLYGQWAIERLGAHVAAGPDLNGDGVGDLLAYTYQADHVVAFAPATNTRLYQQPSPVNKVENWDVVPCGDRDGDGIEDYFEAFVLRSGLDGRLLHDLLPPGTINPTYFAHGVAATVDVDGDGFIEILVGGSSSSWDGTPDVRLYSVRPGIHAGAPAIHALSPAPVDLALEFPAAEVGQTYRVLASFAPTGTTAVAGFELPLVRDPLMNLTAGTSPAWLAGGAGTVPPSRTATATLSANSATLLGLLGSVMRLAVITHASGTPRWSSVAVPVTVLP